MFAGTYLHNHRRERRPRLDGGPHQRPPIVWATLTTGNGKTVTVVHS